MVGTSHSFISKVEGGNHIPTIPVLKRILTVLDEELLIGIELNRFPTRSPSAKWHRCRSSPRFRCAKALCAVGSFHSYEMQQAKWPWD